MLIRKLFKFEASHIVRDCSSERCKFSNHGHSFKVEIFLTSDKLDNGQMLVDFGLLKGNIHDFIDSFDHSYLMWNKEEESFKEFFWKNNARVIELPHSPSAEMLSLMFFFVIDKIIQNTNFHNGEGNVDLVAVRIHETETGYAESCRDDLRWWKWELFDIHFSVNIFNEWKDQMWWINLINKIRFSNPFVELHSQYQDE